MPQEHRLDALVVGAGFTGIYALHVLLSQGFNAKAIDKAPEVGGTWWWNRYPGAMSDTWSHLYRYSFDKELLETYPWPRWYVTQPEVLEYLRHVVDRHNLRQHLQLATEMNAARWDDQAKLWHVTCSTGDVFVVRYLLTGLGLLNQPLIPDIPGIETFRGNIAHTASWDPTVSVDDKRVGVVGVGSSGVQFVTAVAPRVKSLHVFIRRAQYSIPSGNRLVGDDERRAINARYRQIWAEARASSVAMGFPEPNRQLMDLSPADREQLLENLYQSGSGLRFMLGGFADVLVDRTANEEVCHFLRKKIAGIVKDPAKRAMLTPTESYARRPLCDDGYYERFNQDNVFAVEAMKNPITAIVPEGIRMADGTVHELDVIVLATGFVSFTGSYASVALTGRHGPTSLHDLWENHGASTYLGMSVAGFPNLLVLNGPTTAFANIPPLAETNVEFAVELMKRAESLSAQRGYPCEIEATAEAAKKWAELCEAMAEGSIFRDAPSWLFRQNIPGKKSMTQMYVGGLGRLRGVLADVKRRGYEGFKEPVGQTKAHL
ncbi:flavin-containing monooxygenase [Aspergillus candidus]|uniref:Putative cyclohexanone monooxygenase n=1 Tax=Aspergillus candidus TaxID=41067 RepID=A0A2I2FFQ4_ASPCN|nr:putative cyclohexanone monooxygenase [Aspergillus candidus]PLB39454.1 putative cyclohexanone monooxygenase [Aspergillus candidus]